MGSNQSSASKGPQSFSVDPSGHITRRESSTAPAPVQEEPVKEQQQQQFEEEQPVVESYTAPPSRDLSLPEAELIVDAIQVKHGQRWAAAAHQSQRLGEELERKLVQCYRANPGQTMNCAPLNRDYQEHVVERRRQLLMQRQQQQQQVPHLLVSVLALLTCLVLHLSSVHCLGAMSVDLGSEWMKVGLVAPSVQMDIVLNAQSQRKTPMALAFSNGDRFIGEPALDVAGKYPERAFTHFVDLLGKQSLDHPSCRHYATRFPHANLSNPQQPLQPPATPTPLAANSSNPQPPPPQASPPSVLLNHPEGLQFSPLELVAMMLQHAHDQVAAVLQTSEQVATDVVITVPAHFDAQERQLVHDAARLAGLNVLRLTSSNAAFALSYGIFRHHEYLPRTSDNKTTILFVDQGASQTSVTLADYHLVEQPKEPLVAGGQPANESLPTITVRAQVLDSYMGGFDMQLRLRDHLLANFCKLNKIPESQVRARGRSISKLLKESGRVKKILSANTDHTVRVENVINDIDLRQFITRKEFEELNRDYLETRIVKLLDRLFEMPNVERFEPIESVIIVGGNTRTPKLQQTLLEYFKLGSLGKSINGDEGAAMAALYQAASHGRGFRVKKFVLEEFNRTLVEGVPPVEVVPTDAETFAAARLKLSKLREKDQQRLQRLSLKNALESILTEAREKLSAENLDEKLKEVREKLESEVKEASVWLEEAPAEETNNITTLNDKLSSIKLLLRPPPPLAGFDPSNILNLSEEQLKLLKEGTMDFMSKFNLSNPFASSPENETVTPQAEPATEAPQTTEVPPTEGSTVPPAIATPSSASPAPPPHTEL